MAPSTEKWRGKKRSPEASGYLKGGLKTFSSARGRRRWTALKGRGYRGPYLRKRVGRKSLDGIAPPEKKKGTGGRVRLLRGSTQERIPKKKLEGGVVKEKERPRQKSDVAWMAERTSCCSNLQNSVSRGGALGG